MGMREYSCNGYLIDLRIFEKLNKNVTFSTESMRQYREKIKTLELDNFWNEYVKDEDESYDYNFYEYMKTFHKFEEGFIIFSDEDNAEDFEYGVLYLSVPEDELYIKTKTQLYRKLDDIGIDVEYGNYGFWG